MTMLIAYLREVTQELGFAITAIESTPFYNQYDIQVFRADYSYLSRVISIVGKYFDRKLTKQQTNRLYELAVFKNLRKSIDPNTGKKIANLIFYASCVLNRNLRQAIEENHPESEHLANFFYIPLTMLPCNYARLMVRIRDEFAQAGLSNWDIRLVGSQVLYNLLLTWTSQESTDLQQIQSLASTSDFDLKFVPDKYDEDKVVVSEKFQEIITKIAGMPLPAPYDGRFFEPFYYGLKFFNTDLVLTNEPFYHFTNSHMHLNLNSQCVVAHSSEELKKLWQKKITVYSLKEYYDVYNINKLAYALKCVSKLRQLGYVLSTDEQEVIFTSIIADVSVRAECLRKYPEILLPPLSTLIETSAFSSQFPSRGGSPILEEESVELPLQSEITTLIERETERREYILKLACDELNQLSESKVFEIERDSRHEIISSESKQHRQQLRLFELFNHQKSLGESTLGQKDQLLRAATSLVLSNSLLSKRNALQEKVFAEFEGLYRITWMLAQRIKNQDSIFSQVSILTVITYELEKALRDERLQREKIIAQYTAELDDIPVLFNEYLHEEFLYEEDTLREDIINKEGDERKQIPVGKAFLPNHLQVYCGGVITTVISTNEVAQIMLASITDIRTLPKTREEITKKIEVIQVLSRFKKFLPDLHRSHDLDFDTPLMVAVKNGRSENTSLLIDSGALVNHLCADQNTLVYEAASGNHSDVLDVLLLAGAVCDHPRLSTGTTALQVAVGLKYADIVIKLLKAGASPVRKNLTKVSAFNLPIYYFDFIDNLNEQLILVWLLAGLKAHGFKHVFQEYDLRSFLLRSKAKQSVVTFLQKKDSKLDKQVAELAKTITAPEESLANELISFDFVERIGVKPKVIPVAITEKDKTIERMQQRLAQRQQSKK